eukprot:scaffold1554_cov332-Pavlova_lutheri.AAC.18
MCFLPRIGTSVFVVPLVNKTIGRLFVELLHEPGQALPARPSIHPLPSCTVDVPLSGSCRRQSCPHAAPAHVSIRFPSTGIHIRPTGLPSVPFRVPRDWLSSESSGSSNGVSLTVAIRRAWQDVGEVWSRALYIVRSASSTMSRVLEEIVC